MLINAAAASSPMVGVAEEVRHARARILTESKELEIITQLKAPIEAMKEDLAFYEVSAEGLKDKLAKTTAKSTRAEALFDNERTQVIELWTKLAAEHVTVKSIAQA